MTAADTAGTVVISPRWEAGREFTVLGSLAIPEAVETGDTWTISNLLPENTFRVVACDYFGTEFDTNASPTATVVIGDGTDADGYMTSTTGGNANAQLTLMGYGALHDKVYLASDGPAGRNVKLTLGGTVGTAATSGTGYIRIRYYCG